MILSHFLIPKYYQFNKNQNLDEKSEKTVNIAIPDIAPTVRFMILANEDLVNESTSKFSFKMNAMCDKLMLKPNQRAIVNEYIYPDFLNEAHKYFPNIKFLLLHNINIHKHFQKTSKGKIDTFVLGHIKVISAPSLMEIEENAELKKQYWNQIKQFVL